MIDETRDICACEHQRYEHRHAEEKEVANPDAQLRRDCLVVGCGCDQFTEAERDTLESLGVDVL